MITEFHDWFAGKVDFYHELTAVDVDREEITVVGRIDPAAEIAEFRENTREQRMAVAREAEHLFGRKVSWGVQSGDRRVLFTHIAAPVMTRLRQPERLVLDTLVDGGVARSRSEALAWCVRLVEKNADTWLGELRSSLEQVRQVREQGPDRTGA